MLTAKKKFPHRKNQQVKDQQGINELQYAANTNLPPKNMLNSEPSCWVNLPHFVYASTNTMSSGFSTVSHESKKKVERQVSFFLRLVAFPSDSTE